MRRRDASEFQIYFGGVQAINISFINKTTIVLQTPVYVTNETGYAHSFIYFLVHLFIFIKKYRYALVKVVNYDGGSDELDNFFYFTDDCPYEGMYGKGLDCKPCPVGGICPGGTVDKGRSKEKEKGKEIKKYR
jgi:hypothetical protein